MSNRITGVVVPGKQTKTNKKQSKQTTTSTNKNRKQQQQQQNMHRWDFLKLPGGKKKIRKKNIRRAKRFSLIKKNNLWVFI